MEDNHQKKRRKSGRKVNYKDFEELFAQEKNESPKFAALWYSSDGDLGMYFFGYKNATKILLKWYSEPNDDNGTVYPLIFLTRHTIELGLKESIRRAIKLGSNSISLTEDEQDSVWKTHNLSRLIELFNKVMEEYKISEYDDWNELVPFLKKWQAADPDAVFGKYAISKEGIPFEVKRNVSARKIVILGTAVIDILEGVLSMLEEYLNMQAEYNSEFSGESFF